MFKIAAFLTATIYLTACASKSPEYDSSIAPAKSDAKAVVTDSLLPGANIPPTIVQPVTPSGTTIKSQTNTAGLNPAHGQPGHRCEIAVGAPLNSKPTSPTVTNTASKTNPTLVTTPPVISPQLNTTPQVTTTPQPVMNSQGQRLNPAHGQPGHDCKIAVGQPLKS